MVNNCDGAELFVNRTRNATLLVTYSTTQTLLCQIMNSPRNKTRTYAHIHPTPQNKQKPAKFLRGILPKKLGI